MFTYKEWEGEFTNARGEREKGSEKSEKGGIGGFSDLIVPWFGLCALFAFSRHTP